MVERTRELYALGRHELQAEGGRRKAEGGRRKAEGGWRKADGGWRMAARTQTAPSSAVRWLILKPGYRTDLGRASNAPRVDAREEGGLSAYSERLPENRPRAETGAKPGKTVGRQPAWNGRFSQGWLETRVNSAFSGRQDGSPRGMGVSAIGGRKPA